MRLPTAVRGLSGDCSRRMLRGGSWYSYPDGLRSSYRLWDGADTADDDIGFRVVRTLVP